MSFEEDQTLSPPNMPLWYKDSFELKSTENPQVKKGISPELPLPD